MKTRHRRSERLRDVSRLGACPAASPQSPHTACQAKGPGEDASAMVHGECQGVWEGHLGLGRQGSARSDSLSFVLTDAGSHQEALLPAQSPCTRAHSRLRDRHSLSLRPPSLRCCPPRDAWASWGCGGSAVVQPWDIPSSPHGPHQNRLAGRGFMALPHSDGAKCREEVASQTWPTSPQAHAGLGVLSAW